VELSEEEKKKIYEEEKARIEAEKQAAERGSTTNPGLWIVSPIAIAATVVWVVFFTFWWILWAVLMYRTYHGRLYKIPWFGLGNFAERMIAKLDGTK
jgi:hypothetical protein